MRITKSFVDKAIPPKPKPDQVSTQDFYRDTAIPGFALRVTSGGAKSFIVEKRVNGRVKRITLGRYGNLTVEQARTEAMKILGKVATGGDPIAEKRERYARSVSLMEVYRDYLATRKDLKDSTIHDYNRIMNGAFEDWLKKPIAEITKDMVERKHRELGKRSEARANNSMRVLRALINHAMSKYEDAKGNPIIIVNPVERLSQTRAWYKVERRKNLIKPHQLKGWYEATLQLNQETTRDYLHFLLFTGLRRTEAAQLRWEYVNFEDQTFTIPDTKNGESHTLPFSNFIESMLIRRHESRQSHFVFPSDSKTGYIQDPRKAILRVSELSGVEFRLHDLRRTFITIAESRDIPAYALKRLLNHKDSSDVTSGYIISDISRLRSPMRVISDFILRSID
ncbi:tyrosine-type recombinase/integrase [Methylophaga thiooxydans]|uniref:Site-specific recombinase, phage integrase family protein n=1 Tax=Methylophaga thiooxydans DMS010 TaxID=637616 RepID=C0N614_9GAMM|nr:integrase family protein [Methylophaga thiooxydans]EEF80043.1 site-specific recombinase, phage integrase family protein [Methylophaga thiooxydans DMS010]